MNDNDNSQKHTHKDWLIDWATGTTSRALFAKNKQTKNIIIPSINSIDMTKAYFFQFRTGHGAVDMLQNRLDSISVFTGIPCYFDWMCFVTFL